MAIFPGSAIPSGGYDIDNSLQFNGQDERLTRTPSSDGNRQTWTWSGWVKRSEIGSGTHVIFGTRPSGTSNQNTFIAFNSSDQIYVFSRNPSDVVEYTLTTTEVFRDPSAWYHIVFFLDTTESVSENRMELYVNGVRMSSFNTYTQPTSKDLQCYLNQNIIHHIGSSYNDSYFDGYMTEVHFVDGQALDPTYFGETDSTYGHWIPKEYTGTYGTNGFYLDFEDTFNNDKSGNGNNWTASGLVSGDVTTDSPTLTDEDTSNFCTLNILDQYPNGVYLHDGGLEFRPNTVNTGGFRSNRGTMTVPSGKWYFEGTALTTSLTQFGVSDNYDINQGSGDNSVSVANAGAAWDSRGYIYYPGGAPAFSGGSFTTNDVIMVAFDVDTGKIWFGKNGTWVGSGDPANGTNPSYTTTAGIPLGPHVCTNASGGGRVNFGQKSFDYTMPTGFKKLNTYNLDDPAVVPGDYFNTALYTGNSAEKSITGVGFQPDITWVKNRDYAASHSLTDAVRGATKRLYPDLNYDQTTYSAGSGFVSFDSDGFTVDVGLPTGTTGYNYAAWNWKAGNAITLNEDGAITSNTSVNTSAGISIATYRGTGSSTTVGHGLGVAPDMVIVKARNTSYGSNAGDWIVWHNALSATERMYLNYNLAKATGQTTTWNSTLPSSTVVSLGNNIHVNYSSTSDYVMYSFAGVDGFSKFGKYVGNGSTDGPFVYTGFRPAWLLIKDTSSTQSWYIFDVKRSTYNAVNDYLLPNATNAEATNVTARDHDFLSNGFKIRNNNGAMNTSGVTYIYAAFAEYPFKYSNARGTSYDKFTAPSQSALTIGQSARYDGSASTLTRTPSVASNKKTWTWSGWLKKSEQATTVLNLMAAKINGLTYPNTDIAIQNDNIRVWSYTGSAGSPSNTFLIDKISTRVLRDPSAWYHIVVALDTTHATAEERCRIYVNGERITDFSTNTNPSQDRDLDINGTTQHTVGGSAAGSGGYLNGNLAEVNFVDGQALGPESFGYKDSTYGDWRPRSYSDFGPEVDYGPNGFRLDFQAGALGTDVSGNGNDWTLGSMSSTNDVVLDSPSNNFATLNPLAFGGTGVTLSEGGLKFTNAASNTGASHSTIEFDSGKWYCEVRVASETSTGIGWFGIKNRTTGDYAIYYAGNGNKYFYLSGSLTNSAYGATYTVGDIIGIAYDADSGNIEFFKNGSSQGTFDTTLGGESVAFFFTDGASAETFSATLNFGQDSSFAGAETRQSNQDDNGVGDFYYSPPTGYLALCTSNLDAPSVVPTDYFNTVLWDGSGSDRNIEGYNFKPDLFISRLYDYATNFAVFDATRDSGFGKYLSTNLTNAEASSSAWITSVNDGGISVTGGPTYLNASGYSYVGWGWNSGDSVVVNTVGSLSANVCANTASGMSIITWSGTGNSSDNVGTGLSSSKPLKMAIVKRRDSTSEWQVGHVGIGTYAAAQPSNFAYHCELNSTSGSSGSAPYFMGSQSTTNGDRLFLGSGSLASGSDWVAYVWQEVPGFSKFGSYTGTGSNGDGGPFIYTGFRPAWVMLKEISASTEHWFIYDNKRNAYNLVENRLMPNLNNVADNLVDMGDFTSNGFKIRSTGPYYVQFNRSGATIIYAAFAEYPFKYANAR